MRQLILALAAACLLVLCGCVTQSSVTMISAPRPATKANQVLIYSVEPNQQFTSIANIICTSRTSMNAVHKRLKREAAKVGANAVIITRSGSQYSGSVGYSYGSATAYGNPYSATAFGSSTAIMTPLFIPWAVGEAIYISP
jgi:uncharacterized protein YceK